MGIKKTKLRIIPNDNDGNFNVEIPLKTDSVYYNNNSFKVKLTDSQQTLEETININEDSNTELKYSVSSSSTQTTEGGTAIDLTVTVDNAVGGNIPSRQISLTTNGTDDVTLISPLTVTSTPQTFPNAILATDDNLVENDEPYTVTLTDNLGSFDSAGSYVPDSIALPITILDDDIPQYTLSVQDNETVIDENGGTVTFIVETNIIDGQTVVEFEIIENIDEDTGLSADNIDIDNITVTGGSIVGEPEITQE